MPNLRKITATFSVLATFILIAHTSNAQEHEPWTGSVVGASINFNNHDTLTSIRKMINQSKTISLSQT